MKSNIKSYEISIQVCWISLKPPKQATFAWKVQVQSIPPSLTGNLLQDNTSYVTLMELDVQKLGTGTSIFSGGKPMNRIFYSIILMILLMILEWFYNDSNDSKKNLILFPVFGLSEQQAEHTWSLTLGRFNMVTWPASASCITRCSTCNTSNNHAIVMQ